ncbi:MAG TPA: 50S ribosomal protein L6 [Bacilli bacterium]|nr:50S ribosomal protein L6 [Bacilli bacterium]
MSRIGYKVIDLPSTVTVTVNDGVALVKGPKGTLEVKVPASIDLKIEGALIHVSRENEERQTKENHGTFRALLHNAIVGVSEGFSKTLEIVGIGYRAALKGHDLLLNIGFAHDIIVSPEPGVKITCKTANIVIVEGIDRQAVGQTAARIREVRKPEPYGGKGIKYAGEHIIRKEGKRASAKK